MTNVARFDVLGGSGANFRNVRRVDFAGFRAQAEGFHSLAREAQRTQQTFQRIEENAVRNAMAQRDIDLDLKVQEVREDNRLNPGGFLTSMETYVNTTADELPDNMRNDYLLRAWQKTAAAFIQERRKFMQNQVEMNERESNAFIELHENRLKSYGAPDNDIELDLLEQDQAIYDVFVNAEVEAGLITPSEAELRKQELNEEMQAGYLLDKMQNSDQPLDLLLDVLDGNTDDPVLQDLTPMAKQKALSQGQQLFNAIQQIEQRNERVLTEAVNAQKTTHVDNVYTNPTSPSALDSMETLKRLATTPEERIKLQKLDEFIAEAETARYNTTDAEIEFQVEGKLARGELTQNELDDLHGNGLSNSDFNKYRAKLDNQREGLVSSPTYRLVQERMDSEFPSPRKINFMDEIMYGGRSLAELTAEQKQNEVNERLKTQALIDLKTRILDDKTITSEGDLLEAGNAAIVKLRQEVAQGVKPDTPSKPVVLTRQKQVAMQNPEAVDLSKKYSGNLDQLKRDVKAGKIDRGLAREVYNILKEDEDGPEPKQ